MQHSRMGDGVGTCALAKTHRRPLLSCSKIASCGVAYNGRGLASSLLIGHDDDVHHPAGQSLIGLRIVWPQIKV